ncbi:MAG TPA: hypothetical protein VEV39_01965 [Gemmatimonadales bacterium]|nr:hypothetical protein [Gemmatimonadales bacterium]
MSPRLPHLLRIGLAAAVAACSNAGADRVLMIPGAGQVRGLIYLDRNGDTTFGGFPDVTFPAARVALVGVGTVDTVARATSDSGTLFAGTPVNFSLLGIPVGSYRVAVDTLTIPHDSMRITRIDSSVVITPGETSFVRIAVSFPAASPAGARSLPLRTKVFVVGVALANANAFGDSTNSIADSAGAVRITQIKPTVIVGVGDSVRILGTVDTLDGQHVIRMVSLLTLGIQANTPINVLTVGQAKTANGGTADAGLAAILGRVVILDTSTGQAGRILHVTDTTGSLIDTLEVHLDTVAGFDTTAAKRDTVGSRVRLRGILLPSTVPGRWLLKPRAPGDQT